MQTLIDRLAWANACKAEARCRCCGKALGILERDGAPIHTKCIPNHWGKHAHQVNSSKCHEFGR